MILKFSPFRVGMVRKMVTISEGDGRKLEFLHRLVPRLLGGTTHKCRGGTGANQRKCFYWSQTHSGGEESERTAEVVVEGGAL